MCGSICERGSLSLMSKLMYASLGSFVHKVQHLSHDINHCPTEITRFSPSLWQQVTVIVPCASNLQSSINRVCELNTTNWTMQTYMQLLLKVANVTSWAPPRSLLHIMVAQWVLFHIISQNAHLYLHSDTWGLDRPCNGWIISILHGEACPSSHAFNQLIIYPYWQAWSRSKWPRKVMRLWSYGIVLGCTFIIIRNYYCHYGCHMC